MRVMVQLVGAAVALSLGAPMVGLAAPKKGGGGGPPAINTRATCEASEKAVSQVFGDATRVTVEGCMRQESEALKQIEKDWASFPAADKARCARPKSFMPSYVEMLTCLESASTVTRIRKEQKEKDQQGATGARPAQRPR